MVKLKNAIPENIIKRDGSVECFDATKISNAIMLAGRATTPFSDEQITDLTNSVIDIINHKFSKDQGVFIEKIQDMVESVLISHGFVETARDYILYREKRRQARTVVDVENVIDGYLEQLDWRVKENANIGYSLGGMIINNSGAITANYWLNHVYPAEIGEAHRRGDYHIHDLYMLCAYCAGWSLRALLEQGFNGVPGHIETFPPKHLSTAVGQIVNFTGTLQNEWGGAQAFSSVDVYLAPFVRVDKLTYKEVKQQIQQLIFNFATPSRWGTQTPFTNFTFDLVCPEDLKSQRPKIGGEYLDFTYGELQTEMDMINRAFIEVMTEGDAKGRLFTFPMPTYNITNDFDWNSEIADLIFEMTAKYGVPSFQNFINSDLKPTDVRSMCCRLRLDVRELLKRGNGLFGSAEMTGSIGVVTINCARLGFNNKGNLEGLYYQLDHLMDLAKKSLEIKRKTVTRLMDGGLYPFTKRWLGTFRNHFSTIGINGVNEMIRNFTNDEFDITDPRGQKMALEFMDHMREKMQEYQEETGNLYNLEATPAEGAMYRFAKEDQKAYGDAILQAGTKAAPFYTNSTQLPVGFTDDPFLMLDLQEELQMKYTGGTSLHIYLAERVSSADAAKNIIKKVFNNYQIPFMTLTPTFSICPKHGYIKGEHEYCPICDEELLKQAKPDNE